MPYKSKADRAAASKRHYEANKQAHHDRQYIHRNDVRLKVQEIKSNTPCADCGQLYHFAVMDFDHVRGEKLGNIGTMIATKRSWKMILAEIEKCELVCACCHRVRTYNRLPH